MYGIKLKTRRYLVQVGRSRDDFDAWPYEDNQSLGVMGTSPDEAAARAIVATNTPVGHARHCRVMPVGLEPPTPVFTFDGYVVPEGHVGEGDTP